jgi:hypothetical protein
MLKNAVSESLCVLCLNLEKYLKNKLLATEMDFWRSARKSRKKKGPKCHH